MGQQGQRELCMLHDCPHVVEDRTPHTEVGRLSWTTALEPDPVGRCSSLGLVENDALYSYFKQEL